MAFKCQVGERNSKTVKMQSWNQTRLATKKISTEWPKAMYTCNRKLKINTDNGRKIGANPPSVSCFDGLWSCIRCQLRTKNRKQFNYKENGVAQPQEFSGKDGVQNRHMDDQQSILPSKQLDAVSSTYAKEDMVNGVVFTPLKEDLQPDTKVSRIEPADRTTTMKLKMDHSTTFALKSIWKKYIIDGNAQGYIHSEKDINMAVDCAFTTRRYFNYDMAHFYLACLTIAFQYFIHRDMNPANLFPDSKGFLKLVSQPQELSRSQGLTPQREQQQSGVASQITDPYLPKLLEPKNIQLNDLAYVATLGQGRYGRVELMKLKTDHSSTFALKSICKKYIIDKNEQEDIHSEKDINMAVDCAFTTRMYWAHTDRKYIYMLLEVCLGGDLQRLLKRRRYFNYDMARFYTACTTLALQYLHTSGIIHRDVKPANLFLDSKGFLKLGDFGFAERINAGQKLWDPCGTVFYKAPEMFKVDGHDKNADYWSLGVVVFEMLCGRRPFEGCRQEETIRYILDGGIDMASFSPRVGLNARSLVKQLCHENPCRRAKGIKQHPWFLNFSWESLIARSMRPPYVPKVNGPTDTKYFKKHHGLKIDPPDVPSGCGLDF